jgi:hypothetical protein
MKKMRNRLQEVADADGLHEMSVEACRCAPGAVLSATPTRIRNQSNAVVELSS